MYANATELNVVEDYVAQRKTVAWFGSLELFASAIAGVSSFFSLS
jgi:hypothetical protein